MVVKIEKKYFGMDWDCDSCDAEYHTNYEITFTLCEDCLKKPNWKKIIKNIEEELQKWKE
jgi:hypothetical protein